MDAAQQQLSSHYFHDHVYSYPLLQNLHFNPTKCVCIESLILAATEPNLEKVRVFQF